VSPPPASPPDAPDAADYDRVVTWKVVLNGTVEDFDQAATKAALVASYNQPSITAEHITLTVVAGSIIVTGEVRLEDASVTFSEMSDKVMTLFNNATAMAATFGLPVISFEAPTLSFASKPPAAPPPPVLASPLPPSLPTAEEGSGESSDDIMLPIIIGASAGGGCVVLALIVGIAAACLRKKKNVQPLLGSANSPAAAVAQAGAATGSVTSARPSRVGLPSSLRPKSKKVAMAPAAEGIYNQMATDPAAGLTQAEFAAASAQLPGAGHQSETAKCLATMAAAGAGSTPFSAQVEAPLAPLAPHQGPAGGAGAGAAGMRPLAPPLTPLGGAGDAPGLRPLAPLGHPVGGGGRGLAPLRPLGS
jgi:hypothetical protein